MFTDRTQRILRYTILTGILILVTVLGRLHSMLKLYPAIDAFCPFGGLESLFVFLKYNAFLKRIALSSMILFGTVILTAVLFRRSFCGNICPLGFLQELSAKLGRLILRKRFFLPSKADRIMRFVKYIILSLVIAGTWYSLSLIFRPLDPWAAYHHIGSGELLSEYPAGITILILSLAASFFIDRAFCKYICPMGAFLAPVSKLGLFRIRNNHERCTSCGACDEICPMNISIADKENITSAECINCMECTAACPAGALSVSGRKAGRPVIKPWMIIMLTAVIFVIIIGATTFTKQFVWKTPTGLPHRTERLLWGPQKIKADNTFEDIIRIYRINPSFIMQSYSLSESDLYLPISELNISADELEIFVTKTYTEAGLDPKRVYAGGSCGGH